MEGINIVASLPGTPKIGAEVEITSGHRPVSVQIVKATEQMHVGLDKMSVSLYFV